MAEALDHDAQVMTNARLEELLADQPDATADEIVRINTDARPRALQVALLVPILAALAGLVAGFRMARLPGPTPATPAPAPAAGSAPAGGLIGG